MGPDVALSRRRKLVFAIVLPSTIFLSTEGLLRLAGYRFEPKQIPVDILGMNVAVYMMTH